MYTLQPKKMVIINILDILKKYSDIDHPLTQADIVEKLKKEYYMEVDRKTVKRNLMNLLDLDCGIEYTEIMKKTIRARTSRSAQTGTFQGSLTILSSAF